MTGRGKGRAGRHPLRDNVPNMSLFDRPLVTVQQLEGMTPNQRAEVFADHIVRDLSLFPENIRNWLLATGQRLQSERSSNGSTG